MLDTNNAEQSQPVETQPTLATPVQTEDPVIAHERAAFMRYVQDQGQKIPSNFKSADDWFNSLVEARKGFTQARQEIAALKKQYTQNGVSNPNYVADSPQTPVPEPVVEDLSGVQENLQISPATPKPVNTPRVSEEDWVRWGREIDSGGSVSSATRKEMQEKMGAPDTIIDQLVKSRRALAKQSWEDAASVVGGNDNLKRMFKWAQENLSAEEVAATNRALQTTAYKNVLLGLKAQYESSQPQSKPQSQEPQVLSNRVNPSQVPSSVQVFKNFAEQQAALRDPRYRVDANYRQAVEAMVVNSSRYGYLGNR